MRTVLRGLIAAAAKASSEDEDEGEEWEELSGDDAADALATLDVSDKAAAKA